MPSNLFDVITTVMIIMLHDRCEIFSEIRLFETDKRDFESCFEFEMSYTKVSTMNKYDSIEKMQE